MALSIIIESKDKPKTLSLADLEPGRFYRRTDRAEYAKHVYYCGKAPHGNKQTNNLVTGNYVDRGEFLELDVVMTVKDRVG